MNEGSRFAFECKPASLVWNRAVGAVALPDGDALLGGEEHGVALLDVEGIVPCADVPQGAVHAPFAQGVDVGLGAVYHLLLLVAEEEKVEILLLLSVNLSYFHLSVKGGGGRCHRVKKWPPGTYL